MFIRAKSCPPKSGNLLPTMLTVIQRKGNKIGQKCKKMKAECPQEEVPEME